MALSASTSWCRQRHHPPPRLLLFPERMCAPLRSVLLPPLPQAWTPSRYFLSLQICAELVKNTWSGYFVCVDADNICPFYLAFFTEHNVLTGVARVRLCVCAEAESDSVARAHRLVFLHSSVDGRWAASTCRCGHDHECVRVRLSLFSVWWVLYPEGDFLWQLSIFSGSFSL